MLCYLQAPVQPDEWASVCEQGGGEVRVRAHAEVHLHPRAQVRHQVGKDLLLSSQMSEAFWKGEFDPFLYSIQLMFEVRISSDFGQLVCVWFYGTSGFQTVSEIWMTSVQNRDKNKLLRAFHSIEMSPDFRQLGQSGFWKLKIVWNLQFQRSGFWHFLDFVSGFQTLAVYQWFLTTALGITIAPWAVNPPLKL